MADNKKIEIIYSPTVKPNTNLGGCPFKEGAVVVLAGATTACIRVNGKEVSDKRYPVFMTNVGPLWPSMIKKAKIDAERNIHRCQKGFKELADTLAEKLLTTDSDADALKATSEVYENKGFRIEMDEFGARTADGRAKVDVIIDATIIDLDPKVYKEELKVAEDLLKKFDEDYK